MILFALDLAFGCEYSAHAYVDFLSHSTFHNCRMVKMAITMRTYVRSHTLTHVHIYTHTHTHTRTHIHTHTQIHTHTHTQPQSLRLSLSLSLTHTQTHKHTHTHRTTIGETLSFVRARANSCPLPPSLAFAASVRLSGMPLMHARTHTHTHIHIHTFCVVCSFIGRRRQ